MRRHAIAVVAVLLAIPQGLAAAATRSATYCLIVSQSSPVRDLSLADAQRIFLGTRTRWPGGRPIVVVIPPEGSPARDFLLRKVAELSDIDFSQRWVAQVYRGAVARAPDTASTAEELRKLVATSDITIGLIDCRDLGPSVRALTINEKRPGDPGYALGE